MEWTTDGGHAGRTLLVVGDGIERDIDEHVARRLDSGGGRRGSTRACGLVVKTIAFLLLDTSPAVASLTHRCQRRNCVLKENETKPSPLSPPHTPLGRVRHVLGLSVSPLHVATLASEQRRLVSRAERTERRPWIPGGWCLW